LGGYNNSKSKVGAFSHSPAIQKFGQDGRSIMPRRRIPKEQAELTGAVKRNPARFAGRSDPRTGRLGKASPWLSADQAAVWELFRNEFPWLQESDRGLVEIATVLRARVAAGDSSPAVINLLRLCTNMMGGSPADRSKVTLGEEPGADPTDVYFN
jgi:hypothetical protein